MNSEYFSSKAFNMIRNLYISLILKIKLFFHKIFFLDKNTATSESQGTFKKEKDLQTQDNEQTEIWYDALEEQEEKYFEAQACIQSNDAQNTSVENYHDTQDKKGKQFKHIGINAQNIIAEEYFDAREYNVQSTIESASTTIEKEPCEPIEINSDDTQNTSVDEKRYEDNKYYSLQSRMEEKKEIDDVKTLALAFQIDRIESSKNNKVDFSSLKLNKIQYGGSEYYFHCTNKNRDSIVLCTKRLNMYFPKYFAKHGKSCDKIFPEREYNFFNHIVIPLKVPKEASLLTEKAPLWNLIQLTRQSQIPELKSVYLPKYEKRMRFNLDSDNISLSLGSMEASLLGIPQETKWPVKDILIQGSFANHIGVNKDNVKSTTGYNNAESIKKSSTNHTKNDEESITGYDNVGYIKRSQMEINKIKAKNKIETNHANIITEISPTEVRNCTVKDAMINQPPMHVKKQSSNINKICASVIILAAVGVGISILTVSATLGVMCAGFMIIGTIGYYAPQPSTQMDRIKQEQPVYNTRSY
jgi:hypothetical protein